MGYTFGGRSITINFSCCSNGNISVDTKSENSVLLECSDFQMVLFNKKFPLSTENRNMIPKENLLSITGKYRFILKGGFYKTKDSKRHLFFAGQISRPYTCVRYKAPSRTKIDNAE